MKKTSHARLRRILAMIAALTILLATLTACNKKGGDTEDYEPEHEEVEYDDNSSTSAPTETEAPTETTAPAVPTISATIRINNLNIRTSPSSTSAILGQLDAGDKVEIFEQQTADGFNWGRIEQGWIRLDADFVTIDGQGAETPEDETTTPTETAPTEASGTAVNMTGTVTAGELNIRSGPDTSSKSVGKYKKGDKVTITETKNGWGKTDKGWVKLSYIDTKGTTNETEKPTSDPKYSTLVTNGSKTALGTVKITVDALNVRYGPGNSYEVVKKVYKGNSYSYYQKDGDWFRISDGWIYTKGYTDVGTDSGNSGTGTATGSTGTGTTLLGLNIRKEPNNKAEIVGGYTVGSKVTILETKDGWGRTDKGWVSLKYVKMDGNASGSGTASGTSTVTASELNIRKEPSTSAESIGKYVKGDKVTILETKDGWGRTDKGWISMDYVKSN